MSQPQQLTPKQLEEMRAKRNRLIVDIMSLIWILFGAVTASIGAIAAWGWAGMLVPGLLAVLFGVLMGFRG